MLGIGIMVGSLRKESINRKIANALVNIGHPEVDFSFIDISRLPMFNQDMEDDLPPEVVSFKKQVSALNGIIFVSPEYNRSIPAALKNAIDWASRPYGQNSLAGKRAAMVTVALGAAGGAVAMSHLRSILPFLMEVSGQPEVCISYKEGMFNDKGELADERLREFLQGFITNIVKELAQAS